MCRGVQMIDLVEIWTKLKIELIELINLDIQTITKLELMIELNKWI